MTREPFEGQVPKPYFLPQGLTDGYFHPGAQTAIGGALGTTLIGDEVDPTLPRTLRLDGHGTLTAYPLRNNENGVTAGTVQMQTPFELGHYIVFHVASVSAQTGCFLQSVGSPAGPAIVSPRGIDDACDYRQRSQMHRGQLSLGPRYSGQLAGHTMTIRQILAGLQPSPYGAHV